MMHMNFSWSRKYDVHRTSFKTSRKNHFIKFDFATYIFSLKWHLYAFSTFFWCSENKIWWLTQQGNEEITALIYFGFMFILPVFLSLTILCSLENVNKIVRTTVYYSFALWWKEAKMIQIQLATNCGDFCVFCFKFHYLFKYPSPSQWK